MKLELQEMALEKVAIPDLRRLKELSERLQLSPKRQSVLQWQYDLKELQSEGIYPLPARARKLANFIEEESDQSATQTPKRKVKVRRKLQLLNEDEKKEKSVTETASEYETNHKTAQSGTETFLNKTETKIESSRSKYFRQRSSEDCQKRIRDYGLRLEANSEEIPEEGEKEKEKPTTAERYNSISQALKRIRTDLLDMRIRDNTLARQLLDKRHEFLQVKAVKTCEQHATMIDDFSWELEIEEELTEQLRSFDIPSNFLRGPNSLLASSSPLRLMGISRMTLDSKRFSVI